MRIFAWTAAAATIALLATNASAAEQDFSNVEITTTDLGHYTYMLEADAGGNGNVTITVGTDGVIMVDSMYAPMHDKLKAAIAKVTNQRVKYLINTHYHRAGTSGNAAFGKEGVTIVGHQNLKDRLLNPPRSANGETPDVSPPEALPTQIFADRMTVSTGGRTAQVVHTEGHTNTDAVIYFADANVIAIGDVGGAYRYPSISQGGTIDGMIAGVRTYLNMINDQTKIVPHHGPLTTKAEIQESLNMLVKIRDRVAALKAEGASEDQAVAAKPLAPDIQEWAQSNDTGSDRVVRATYQTLK